MKTKQQEAEEALCH